MKYVSFIFAVALLAGVAKADHHEQSVSFHYNNHHAFYACSYAEAQMAKTLETLGAENVETNCSGGIDHDQMLPVSVDATFTHAAKGERTVVLKGRESCDFNVKLINTVLSTIDHVAVKAKSYCNDAQGSYRFEITLK